ncbi:MAG: hypothetical protein ACNFW9_02585 [Candidatus Kerfeldbacteria bacterium]|jgi:hypothetical protein
MKGKFVILFIIIILALSSTSVAAMMFWQGKNFPIIDKVVTAPFIESAPKVVFDEMFKQMNLLSTARYDLKSAIELDVYDETFNINLSSVFEGDLIGKPIGRMTTGVELQMQSLNFFTTVESRFTEDKIYYSVTEVPAIPFVDLNKIHNNWYEYQWSDSMVFNDNFLGIDSKYTNDYINNIVRLPDEFVNGKISYHYLVSLNIQNIPNLFHQFNLIDISSMDKLDIEIWIGKQSFRPYQITSEHKKDGAKFSNTLTISEFNESVALDRPENGISTDKMIEDLFDKTNVLDLSVFGYIVGIDDKYILDDPDQDNLYSIWEDVFGTNKDNADTDDDGFLDGDEIRNGYNPNGTGRLIK